MSSSEGRSLRPGRRRSLGAVFAVFAVFAAVAGCLAALCGASLAAQPEPSRPGADSPAPSASSSAKPTSASPDDVHVLLLSELQAEVAAAREDGKERTVVAYAALDPSKAADHPSPQCLLAAGCPKVVGEITGVPGRPVWADPVVADSLIGSTPTPAEQLLALRFGSDDVISLLGVLLPQNSATVRWPASRSALQGISEGIPGWVVAVDGWLNSSGPLPCPMPAPPTPPPDSPFVMCPFSWISAEPHVLGSQEVVTVPPDSIRVQPFALDQYACPDGENGTRACAVVPQEGTWLLQLVEDPRPDADPKRGWQLVGRVSDTPIGPIASPSPSEPSASTPRRP